MTDEVEVEEEEKSFIKPDTPIFNGEEDRLGTVVFAKELAKSIINYNSENCFCIGLEGSWGSGKTSILNMVETELSKDKESIVIIKFSPWLYTDRDQLISQFFAQLNYELKLFGNQKIENEDKPMVSPELLSAISSLGLAYSPLFIESGAFGFAALTAIPVIASALIKKRLKKEEKAVTSIESLQKKKNKVVKKLKEIDFKILVIIDDLDRLPSEEIRAVFQLIKAIADFPNMIYLIAYDREIVVEALHNVQKADGAAYLEKIVQVPFSLPVPKGGTLEELLLEKLSNILPKEVFKEIETEGNTIYTAMVPFFKTIRDITRFCNIICLKQGLLEDEMNINDFLGINTLQIFAPKIYNDIYQNKYTFTEAGYRGGEEQYKEFFPNNNVKQLILRLFPRVNVKSTNEQSLIGRISHPDYFDRYFTLSTSDELSLVLTKKMIEEFDREELKKEFLNFNTSGYLNGFILHFASQKGIHRTRILIIYSTLLEMYTMEQLDVGDFFYNIDILLSDLDEKAHGEFYLSIFRDEKISLTNKLFLFSFYPSFPYFNKGLNEDGETFKQIKNILKIYVSTEIKNNTLFENEYDQELHKIIDRIKDAELQDSLVHYFRKKISGDELFMMSFALSFIEIETLRRVTYNNIPITEKVYGIPSIKERNHLENTILLEDLIQQIENFIKSPSFLNLNCEIEDKYKLVSYMLFDLEEMERAKYESGKYYPIEQGVIRRYCEENNIPLINM